MSLLELTKVYTENIYRVNDPPIDIKIGRNNALLDNLLYLNRCYEWAFVSACNQYDKPLNSLQNHRRHEALRDKLNHYRIYEGECIAANGNAEKGFLIIGIIPGDAARLGILSEQNAIITGKKGSIAELVPLV